MTRQRVGQDRMKVKGEGEEREENKGEGYRWLPVFDLGLPSAVTEELKTHII